MLDLKDKDCTVLLTLPEKANQDFMNGFHASWHVSSLVQVGGPMYWVRTNDLGNDKRTGGFRQT